MSRVGPKARRERGRRTAAGSSGVHDDQSASVTRPETLHATWSSAPNGRDPVRPPTAPVPGRDRRLGEVVDDEADVRQSPREVAGPPAARAVGRGGRRRDPRRRPARMPRTTSSRRSQSGSGSSWTWWRMPTRRSPPGPSRRARSSRPTAGSVRSTQPTTPRMNGVAAASCRNSRVSSRLERVWTRTVASTPAASSCGARSSGANGRRMTREVVGQPRIVGGRRIPEVVVGVDDLDRRHAGTGASGAIRPSARSSAQRSAGIGHRQHRRVLVEMGDAADAGDQRGDRRVGERELDRGGTQRDAVPLADLADPPGPVDERRRGPARSRTGCRAGGRPARRCSSRRRAGPRSPRSSQAGSSVGEGALVEQRVAAREQEDIHVGLAGEPGEHLRLVHARADRARRRPRTRSRASAGHAPSIASCQWSSGSWISAMSMRSRPSRSRLSSSDRRTPSAL